MLSIASNLAWLLFISFILIMLAVDLFVFGAKQAHKVSLKEALLWSIIWLLLAFLFGVGLWFYLSQYYGSELAKTTTLNFFSGYLLEKALSLDNLFVFVLIFQQFKVEAKYQQRILLYGVLGAIILRALMIIVGSLLLQKFTWILYLLGIFLIFMGCKMFFNKVQSSDFSSHPMILWLSKHIRISPKPQQEKFLVKLNGLWYVTPLLLVLILIELSDLIFAFDSIPAIFAITTDPFIVFTSNIFAIMGLRALYFLLANLIARFYYLHYGLALILAFIGTKLIVAKWLHIGALWSLLSIVAILLCSVLLSLFRKTQ